MIMGREGPKYLDDCQEHTLNDQLRWHLCVCTSRITRFPEFQDDATQLTLKLAWKCLRPGKLVGLSIRTLPIPPCVKYLISSQNICQIVARYYIFLEYPSLCQIFIGRPVDKNAADFCLCQIFY